ncbi:C40 family peptidase [Candidatus Synechococcus calcipolaris G9]|uniref:C40 family peptidase n=1 Tax=Candidatus Synechococcus calcipolaris G9 TaxID=1497997 RepID=A0ABT6EY11_9SYNE|nr:C40 family peptidase [Candidatus Synechococcus calcipolaris]MDG2990632.1 C40 family peptidase [Candidatus Synechococcus calcipolaris G9]
MIENQNHRLYDIQAKVDLYDSPDCQRLATQAAMGRKLWLSSGVSLPSPDPVPVQLAEDGYPAWLAKADTGYLTPAIAPYIPQPCDRPAIEAALPKIIQFLQQAQNHPNQYLWGGNLGPNYDCSGLIQASFAHHGIWLPRDAYQQEAFTRPLVLDPVVAPASDRPEDFIPLLTPGDLVFFGTSLKATHVGFYLQEGAYIHSSGQDQGRNGIGIDYLYPREDNVTMAYYQQFRGAGRIEKSYQPQGIITI